MQFSAEQDRALCAVKHWLEDSDQQVFRLFGYAGTGKTTLAKSFTEGLDGRAVFGAFTGKAAYVLRSKGCVGATTIHKLIYTPKSTSKAHLKDLEAKLEQLRLLSGETKPPNFDELEHQLLKQIKEEKANVLRPMFSLNLQSVLSSDDVRLVVIDECSMVDAMIGKDLESFKKKILVLGDPAQLPPVKGTGYFTEVKPDFMLTDIHRQAKDNPIIALATRIREGQGRPSLGTYGSSVVMPKSKFNKDVVLAAGQTLVGMNATRRDFNRRFRELLGRKTVFPEADDKMVCLRNNHEIGLLNGGIWKVLEASPPDGDEVYLNIQDESDGMVVEVQAHAGPFDGKEVPWWAAKDAEMFDYGYALTVHKAQGSQWDDVLVFDESHCFRQNRAQWLYTAITRAAERVTLVVAD